MLSGSTDPIQPRRPRNSAPPALHTLSPLGEAIGPTDEQGYREAGCAGTEAESELQTSLCVPFLPPAKCLIFLGGRTRTRTFGPPIKSPSVPQCFQWHRCKPSRIWPIEPL